jgi:germination protein M
VPVRAPEKPPVKRVLVLVGLFVLLAAGCGGDDSDVVTEDDCATATPSSGCPTTSASGSTTSEPSGEEAEVRVYFARDGQVATAGRTVSAPAVARGAMTELLAGPDEFETDIGLTSEIPAGTDLLGVDIAGGEAVVDLSGEFEAGGGSLSMQVRVAEVVFTLTQFATVETVTIELDGAPVDAIGGEGVDATDLTRDDLQNVTPFILVESPVPGATVTSPLEVSGIANTFEANVQYSMTDGDGLIVDEGFTTASAGNGVWGDFSLTTSFAVPRAGLGAVIVFQEDAATGDQADVYEVPVRVS